MNRLQEHLVEAGSQLGIKVVAPHEIEVDSGRRVMVDAWLPELGDRSGMIVVRNFSTIGPFVKNLDDMGYGFSSFNEPSPDEDFDLEGYVELFNDWGWSATTPPPEWMNPDGN